MATIKKKALVIGAGTGGYPAAIRLGQLGVDAMLVEKHRLFSTSARDRLHDPHNGVLPRHRAFSPCFWLLN